MHEQVSLEEATREWQEINRVRDDLTVRAKKLKNDADAAFDELQQLEEKITVKKKQLLEAALRAAA